MNDIVCQSVPMNLKHGNMKKTQPSFGLTGEPFIHRFVSVNPGHWAVSQSEFVGITCSRAESYFGINGSLKQSIQFGSQNKKKMRVFTYPK